MTNKPKSRPGGGFIVRRRDRKGRVMIGKTPPFEHAAMDDAVHEAQRLADLYPGENFAVFAQVALAHVPKPAAEAALTEN
jgi:hypothetical protein